MDCNCTCIDVQAVLPSIRLPVSSAFLSTQVLLFQSMSLVKLLQVSRAGSQVTRVY